MALLYNIRFYYQQSVLQYFYFVVFVSMYFSLLVWVLLVFDRVCVKEKKETLCLSFNFISIVTNTLNLFINFHWLF